MQQPIQKKGHDDEACVTSARSIAKDGPGLNNPMDGYLVASQPAPDGFGGVIPEDSQGPPRNAPPQSLTMTLVWRARRRRCHS